MMSQAVRIRIITKNSMKNAKDGFVS
jgi:hypothetical protein